MTYYNSTKFLPPELHPWLNFATIAIIVLCILAGTANRIAEALVLIASDVEDEDEFGDIEHPPYEIDGIDDAEDEE